MFRVTVRSLASDDIANDAIIVSRLKKLYDILDSGTTPTTVLLPWLPAPSMIKKLWATREIYTIIAHAVDSRLASGERRDDTLQMLVDAKDERLVMIGVGLLV